MQCLCTREVLRSRSICSQTQNNEDPHAFKAFGYDNAFLIERFRDEFSINIISTSEDTIVFDMVGIDAPLANALRRILIAEVIVASTRKPLLCVCLHK